MKVRFKMIVEMVKEINLENYKQAEDMDDAIEQELAELQDSSTAQMTMLEEADIVTVEGTKLIVR